jgi:menaquinone-dependent protoporphyrinogen oxidase
MSEHDPTSDHDLQRADALVVYDSTHGHTAKIAARLADAMRGEGLAVDLRSVADAAGAEPGRYDVVAVGGSLHREGHQKALVGWVTEHRDALADVPSLFFSVSLTAADDSAESRATAQGCIDDFCVKTGWKPARTEPIAGALQYREYDVFTRQLMRLLMKHMGHPTDTSHDYDYTDWDAVDRLGRELAARAAATAA